MFQQLFREAPAGAPELQEELVGSLRQVKRAEWDRISGGCSLYLSYPFLLSVEEAAATPCSYLLLRDQVGLLVAGLPLYHWDGSRDPGLDHYEPFAAGARWVLGRRARPAPWLPTLIAGSRSGYCTEFAVDPSWEQNRPHLIGLLLGGAARVAETLGASSLGVMWLTSAAARQAIGWLKRPEYLLLAGPNCAIEVTWDSLEGYLAQLSWSRRRSARREMERFRRSGLRVELAQLNSCLDEMAPLAARLQQKYGHALTPPEITEQLAAQAWYLNSHSRVVLCRQRGRLVGFSLLYSWRGALYGRLAGFDYQATAQSDAYFNLAFYIPLHLALDERLGRFNLGMATWRAKVLRGAGLDPAWSIACPPSQVRGAWARMAKAQGDDPSRWWAEQFPRQVDWECDWRWTRAGLAGNVPATIPPQ